MYKCGSCCGYYASNTSSQPPHSQENEVVGHALEKVNEEYVDGDGDVQCGHGDDDDDMHEDETHANEKEKRERQKREADMACKNKKMAQEEERVRKLERARLALEDGCSADDEGILLLSPLEANDATLSHCHARLLQEARGKHLSIGQHDLAN